MAAVTQCFYLVAMTSAYTCTKKWVSLSLSRSLSFPSFPWLWEKKVLCRLLWACLCLFVFSYEVCSWSIISHGSYVWCPVSVNHWWDVCLLSVSFWPVWFFPALCQNASLHQFEEQPVERLFPELQELPSKYEPESKPQGKRELNRKMRTKERGFR